MAELLTKIQKDAIEAQKNGDAVLLSTLRLLTSAIKNKEIELRPSGKELTDEDVIGVIAKQVKQRKESIVEYEKGGRADLVAKEVSELEILSKYLPAQLSQDELEALVDEAIASTGAKTIPEMGKVLGVLMPKVKGKVDSSVVSNLVKSKLGGN